MRLLHTSDWHIGKSLMGKSRDREHEAFLDWLIGAVERERIDVLLVCGDVFDGKTPRQSHQKMLWEFWSRLLETPCKHAVVIAGNHDSPALIAAPAPVMGRMRVRLVGAPVFLDDAARFGGAETASDRDGEQGSERERERERVGEREGAKEGEGEDGNEKDPADEGSADAEAAAAGFAAAERVDWDNEVFVLDDPEGGDDWAIVCAVPYLSESGLRLYGGGLENEPGAQLREATRRHFAQAFARAQAINAQRESSGQSALPIVGMGHLYAQSARFSKARPSVVGALGAIPLDAFSQEAAYWALGHIHRAQSVGGNDAARYSGSPIALSFDELASPRSVEIVDLERAESGLWARSRRSLPVPVFQRMEWVRSDGPDEAIARLKELIAQNESVWVKVTLGGRALRPNFAEEAQSVCEGTAVEILQVEQEAPFGAGAFGAPGAGGTLDGSGSGDGADAEDATSPDAVFERVLARSMAGQSPETLERMRALFRVAKARALNPESPLGRPWGEGEGESS